MAAFRLKADVVAVVAEIKGKGLLFQGGNFFNNFGENKVRITDAVVVIVELAGECVLIVFAEEVELFGKAVTVRRVAAAEMNKDDFCEPDPAEPDESGRGAFRHNGCRAVFR